MTTPRSSLSIAFAASVAALAAACSPASSTSGSGGKGGSTGGGTGGIGSPNCVNSADDLIADFTMDNSLHSADGRQGGFYTYGDDSEKSGTPLAVLDPAEGTTAGIDSANGNVCSGNGALRVKATGFKIWGAATGTNFLPTVGSTKQTYNASKYKGVSFWAKAGAPLTGVQVSFPDVWTDAAANPTALDSTIDPCVYVAGANNNCSPYLVKLGNEKQFPAYKDMQIDTTWRRFDIMFADTTQDPDNGGQGSPDKKIDAAHLTSMAVQVNAIHNPDLTVTANDFEIWLDDVNFLK